MTDKELVYEKIGMILHISQAIEYNLHIIIIYDNIYKKCFSKEEIKDKLKRIEEYYLEYSKQPTGYSIDLARKTKIFTEDFLISLSKAISKRNYYAHRFFKDDFKENNLNNNPKMFLDKLDKDITRLNEMNTELGNDLKELKLRIKDKISS